MTGYRTGTRPAVMAGILATVTAALLLLAGSGQPDKERLFTDIILGVTDSVGELLHAEIIALADTDDLERDLREFARRHVGSVIQPRVVRLRRIVISAADQFPTLGRTFLERGPERVISALTDSFRRLDERGLLRLDDPYLAASHYADLVLSAPLDRAMFCGDEEVVALAPGELHGAAAQIEASPGPEFTAMDRRFRTVRVSRMLRLGRDGPEGPRPSDQERYGPS